MENSIPPVAATEKNEKPSFLKRVIQVAVYPISALTGLWAAGREVHYGTYKTISTGKTIQAGENNPIFKEIKATYEELFAENARKLANKTISETEFLSEFVSIKAKHSNAVGVKMESMGLGNKWLGLKDLPKKLSVVNRDVRSKALISGLTVSGIAIGALLTITNSKLFNEFFSQKSDNDNQISR